MKLTLAQKEAVEFEGNLMVVASAGSGKTRVLVEKVAWLVEHQQVPPQEIAVVTFTEKAAEELTDRLRRKLKNGAQPLIGTIHALCAFLLKQDGKEFSVMDEAVAFLERERTIREGLLGMIEAGEPSALEMVEEHRFRPAVAILRKIIKDRPAKTPYRAIVDSLQREYTQRKREKNRVDFDDLEHLTLAGRCHGDFRWILVDEFQDTSPIQWEILSQLHDPKKNRLVLVGDPRQSIYRFRGADATLFEKIRRQFGKEGRVISLNENFRSEPAVIEMVNRVVLPLFGKSDGAAYEPLVAVKPKKQGFCEILPLAEIPVADERRAAEAEKVGEKILELSRDGVAFGEIALLFRMRKPMPVFEEKLKERSIPFQSSGGESLLVKKEVLSVLLLLRAIAHEEETIPLFGLTQTPLASLKDQLPTLRKSATKGAGTFLPEFLEILFPFFPDETERTNVVLFIRLLTQLTEIGAQTLVDLLRDIDALKKEEAHINAAPTIGSKEAVQLLTIHAAKGKEFRVVFLCDLEAGRPRGSSLFVAPPGGEVLLKERDRSQGGLKEAFQKSEEYLAAEKGEREAEEEEAKRLLYVAMTRAMERLIFPLPIGQKKLKGLMSQWLMPHVDH